MRGRIDSRLKACSLICLIRTTRTNHSTNPEMKNPFALPLIIALVTFCSCQKQTTEEEIRAMVKQEVQQQLAAEQEAQKQQQIERRQAWLENRKKALEKRKSAGPDAAPGSPPGDFAIPPIPGRAGVPPRLRHSRFATPSSLPEAPGSSLPEAPGISETSAGPSGTPGNSKSTSSSPASDQSESASPAPSPTSSDGTPQ
jgi:hypothetical protein